MICREGVLHLAERLVWRACRHLPREAREERRREWTAELPAIIDDPENPSGVRRAALTLLFAVDQTRAAYRLRSAGTTKVRSSPAADLRSSRTSLASIASDPRLPIWERRVALALVAGIATTFIFDWRIGAVVTIPVAILDAIFRSLSTAVMRPILSAAQRKTERKLKALESARYLSLRQRAIPGSDAIIDHVVVGPTGVYAIGSERWDRRLPVRAPGLKQLLHGPFSRKDLLDVARWKAAQATELIQAALGRPVVVRPALVIYGPRLPWTVAKVRNVDVFAGKHLRKYLRGSIKAGRGYRLSIADIEDIYEATVRVLPQWLPATPPVRTRGTDVLEAGKNG